MKFVTELLQKFPELSSGKKKMIVFFSIGIVAVLLGSMFYLTRKSSVSTESRENIKFEEVVPEVRLLGKSLYQETTLKTRRLEQSLNELKQELKKIRTHVEQTKEEQQQQMRKELENLRKMLEKQIKEKKNRQKKSAKKYSSGAEKERSTSGRVYVYTPPEISHKPGESPAPRWVGGIMKLEGARIEKKKESRKKEKEQLTVYLPPSFVSGTLLTGLSAFVSQEGQAEPTRALIRLDDLAVLPNEVKTDLKGCFVIGEAYGNLADEKIHIRLLRLSCVGRDGKSVIDEKVTGWVVDGDTGETGLKGIPVAKFGSFIARYSLAGFFQGFGEAYSSSQSYIEFSTGEGITQLPSPGKAAKAGLGKGIGKVGKGLGDFYLKLAQQTLPVIEAGTGKRVTVVFSEGVELRLKNVCLKGRDGCKIKPVVGIGVLSMIQ